MLPMAVADLGEGLGRGLIFRPNWGPRGRKIFWGGPSLSKGLEITRLPAPLYLKVWIRHCNGKVRWGHMKQILSWAHCHSYCLLLVNTRENDKKTILKKHSIHCEHSDFMEMASCKIKSSAITESAKKHLVTWWAILSFLCVTLREISH